MPITLSAEKREAIGRDNWKNRAAGLVPAVVYGSNIQPKNVAVDRRALTVAFNEAGESTLVDLTVNGDQPVKVLIQDLQFDPLTLETIHVDFRAVDLTKEITANIKLNFIGEAPAVKELGGTMVHALVEIEVRALPTALVHSIDVDVTKLKTFEDAVKISDLILPAGITLVDDLNDTIAVVAPPRSEAELAELDKAVEGDVTAVEVEKKEKKEGDEAEGEEAAAPAEEKKAGEKKTNEKK
ncbi:MAG: 50S ribosomal protein L25 [Patescibacteria group bacterium]|jgi:large subunit ribosomal protein L25